MKPTADLCDEQGREIQACEPVFRDFGGRIRFGGPIVTLETFEDNTKVRTILSEPGAGRVLVIDGGGSRGCALLGGNLAVLAQRNGWSGVLVHGCVRDSAELRDVPIGIKAMWAFPRKSRKDDGGTRDVPVTFAGVTFEPGHYLVADEDGIVVLERWPG